MQGGGVAGIARAKKIFGAQKDIWDRARKIKRKQGSSGFFSKLGSIAGKYALPAALAAFGPASWGASLATKGVASLFAKSFGSGLGSYFGAKLGYGDKVGSGEGSSKWLSPARKQLGKAESDMGKSFKERGIASGATTFAMGAIEGGLKGIGDKFKPDTGEVPMGGGMAPAGLPGGGDLSKAYADSPEGYVGELPGAETFDYKPTGLGAGVGSKALGNQPLIGGSDFSKQLSASGKFMEGWSPQVQKMYGASQGIINQAAPETVDPLSAIGQLEDPLAGLSSGQNAGWSPADMYDDPTTSYPELLGGQRGGYVSGRHGGYSRDDMALLDMIYRR